MKLECLKSDFHAQKRERNRKKKKTALELKEMDSKQVTF